jgi:hypothetical protein
MKRVAMELQYMGPLNKDPALEYMLLQAVRFAFRMHQVTHSSNLRQGKLSCTLRIPYCQQYVLFFPAPYVIKQISHVLISSSSSHFLDNGFINPEFQFSCTQAFHMSLFPAPYVIKQIFSPLTLITGTCGLIKFACSPVFKSASVLKI